MNGSFTYESCMDKNMTDRQRARMMTDETTHSSNRNDRILVPDKGVESLDDMHSALLSRYHSLEKSGVGG